ncbi:hypothetical protein OSTOST_03307 [Ostertagia ostertagi]
MALAHSQIPFRDFDEEQLRDLIKKDGRQISRELAEKMDCDHATILRHLHSMEYTQKLGSWVPHELTEETKASRLRIAAQNLARHRATHGHRNRFLHRIITGDENGVSMLTSNNGNNGSVQETHQHPE